MWTERRFDSCTLHQFKRAQSSMVERSAHNGKEVGSIPTGRSFSIYSKMHNPKEWSDIVGHEGKYEIKMIDESPYVQVRSKTKFKKVLKPFLNDDYLCFNLYRIDSKKSNRVPLHRIVAKQYISNPQNKETVNHKNGIKTDNRIQNLEWNTFEENHKHAVKNNLLDLFRIADKNKNYKGAIEVYDTGGNLIKTLKGKTDIKNNGFNNVEVYRCVNGKAKSHKGCTFKRI